MRDNTFFLFSLGTGRCLIGHLKATVNLYRPHHKWFFNQLSDLKHQLVSIHTYYLSLIKAFRSESKFFPIQERVDVLLRIRGIHIFSSFKKDILPNSALYVLFNHASMRSCCSWKRPLLGPMFLPWSPVYSFVASMEAASDSLPMLRLLGAPTAACGLDLQASQATPPWPLCMCGPSERPPLRWGGPLHSHPLQAHGPQRACLCSLKSPALGQQKVGRKNTEGGVLFGFFQRNRTGAIYVSPVEEREGEGDILRKWPSWLWGWLVHNPSVRPVG